MSVKTNKVTAFEDSGVSLMDRIQGNGGTNITQASLTGIAFSVYSFTDAANADDASAGTLVTSGTLTISAVVFDTLQTAAPWDSTVDSTGYNFRYDALAAQRATGGLWHRYEIVFTPATGQPFVVVWIVETLPLAGS